MENRNGTNAEHGELTRAVNRRLVVEPVALHTARAFVAWNHHLAPPVEAEIVLGARGAKATLVGVVFAGTPVCWRFDDGGTAEIGCLATDGTPNACSALLRAAWRAARAAGYRRLIAYTRADEPGTSLRAAGFRPLTRRESGRQVQSAACVVWEIRAAGGRR
jgi:hypothetical protein